MSQTNSIAGYPAAPRSARIGATVLALLIGFVPLPASGTSCMDDVRAMADRYNLHITPTEIPPRQPTNPVPPRTNTLREGMVVQPPATGDPAVIEPPESAGSRMPTMPDITPDEPETPYRLTAADRIALESILTAARSQAKRGDRESCFKRLQHARDYLADALDG